MRNTLKFYREKLNLSQGEMAKFLGTHRETYNRWENQKPQPSLEKMYLIYRALKTEFPDLNMQDLLSDDDE